ncbi:MAG: hypothetical protein CMM87_05075 [Rickettsiales bacterium]|nr:hypothetical protein [Rickettsiales bacterium]|tara:strand:+ start:27624 stop:28013 length:390 start_codon:yes stop_codon:yes gene_type:complete
MTNPSRAHQLLAEKYGTIVSDDTMIPHDYSPIQRFLLILYLTEDTLHNNLSSTLSETLAQLKLSDSKVKLEHILDEISNNPLILAWIKEFIINTKQETRSELFDSLQLHFPFNNASLKVIQLVLKGIDI